MFARCSTKNGHFSTFKMDVQRVMEATAEAWKGEPGFELLEGMDREGKALKEFMQERRKVWAKRACDVSLFTATSLTILLTAAEVAGADDAANDAASISKKRKLRSVGEALELR